MWVDTNSDLYRAYCWLEKNQTARMPATAKVGTLITSFGGSYKPGNTETLQVAGLRVSCTGGTSNLLNAWLHKAKSNLDSGGGK